MVVDMRSNNMVSTICYDVFMFTSLMMDVADKLELEYGYYYHNIGSAHIMQRDVEFAMKVVYKSGMEEVTRDFT